MGFICMTRPRRASSATISASCRPAAFAVQNVWDDVTWLLKDTPGWDREHIDEAIRSGERIDAKIATAVPVYWVYITAWGSPDGLVQFREDIYQRDGFGAATADAASEAPLPQAIAPEAQAPGQARPAPRCLRR